MRIITLLARHGTAVYADAVDAMDGLFARQMPDVARDLLVIDTALPADHQDRLGAGRTLIGAANTHWEFSAWDRAVACVGERIAQYDVVHLATSAFRMLSPRYLDRFDADMLESIRGRAAALGHIDYYEHPVIVGDLSLRSWLRSSFIFLPPAELQLLGSLVSIDDPRRFFSGDPCAPYRPDAPLSAQYRGYIRDWLTGPGTGQGVAWHSRFELTPATLPLFEAKAMAILNEQVLSARLRAQGCALIDATWLATWLATRRAQQQADDVLDVIPSWRRQITARDVDAAPRSLIEPGAKAGSSDRIGAQPGTP
jgi:hypothetical protein